MQINKYAYTPGPIARSLYLQFQKHVRTHTDTHTDNSRAGETVVISIYVFNIDLTIYLYIFCPQARKRNNAGGDDNSTSYNDTVPMKGSKHARQARRTVS